MNYELRYFFFSVSQFSLIQRDIVRKNRQIVSNKNIWFHFFAGKWFRSFEYNSCLRLLLKIYIVIRMANEK